ncbi:MAG: tetratricopeptide repeat protein, partial [Thermoplasmata archaeon]
MAIREAPSDDLRKKTPLEWYNVELAKKPHDVGLWYAKGALLTKQGDHLEAIACFEKVTEFDPTHYKGWDAEAKAYFRIGDYEKSINALDRLLEMDEENETLWYQKGEAFLKKGEALLKLGKYVEANSCYDKAIDLKPNYADAWCGKGNALKGIGKEDKERKAPDKDEPIPKEQTFKDALD